MREDVAYAEAMLFDYERDWVPDGLEQIERPDLLMWRRRGWPASHSRVAYARWDESAVERGIDEVLWFFGDLPFNWHVGPSSSPSDLGDRLARRGLELVAAPRMMTAALPLAGDWRPRTVVNIVEVHDETTARTSLVLAHHDGEELEQMLPDRVAYLATSGRRGGFLIASIGGQPAGNAGYRYSADGECVYLTGAETVTEHRGLGVYKALVAFRATAAHRRGCRIASILANTDTSAPILSRRGFLDHGPLPRYMPTGTQRVRRATLAQMRPA
jgi:GNAT superfamily N-acetyltransferase